MYLKSNYLQNLHKYLFIPFFVNVDILLYRGKEEIHSEIVNYLLTELVQSNKYKSHAVGVTSRVGLTTDWDQETRLLYLRDIGNHIVWTTIQQLWNS